jgi:phospholipid-binding lipoprotein MlaA
MLKKQGLFLILILLLIALIEQDVWAKPVAQFHNASQDNITMSASPASENPHIQSFNRSVYAFNDKLDRFLLKPLASFYSRFTPELLRHGITNFFDNIDTVATFANDILQFKVYYLLNDSWRFLINTTVGLCGFIDVASNIGLEAHHEDFGLTLAHWGYKHSNYIVVPFLGPATVRDIISWPVDYLLFSVYPHVHSKVWRYGLYSLGMVDRRSSLLKYQNLFDQMALDRYALTRNAYIQHRAMQLQDDDSY